MFRCPSFRFAATCLGLVVALGSGSVGCAGDDAPPFDPMDPRLMDARLEFVTSQTQSLRYGAATDLTVRYVYDDGSPIDAAPIAFAVVGTSGGSAISARNADTSPDGEATVRLTAGSMDAMFRVSVTPPMGEVISFDVAVSDVAAGGIVVRMSYAGMTALDRFRPFLYRGLDCATLDAARLPTADRAAAPATAITEMPSFAGVTPAADWTVAVVGDYMGMPKVFGCADGIAVTAGMTATVIIALVDLVQPTLFVGVYDLDNRFNFAGALPPTVESGIEILDELTDDDNIMGSAATMDYGQDPGAFIVDFAMRQTCGWECMGGEDFDSCSEINHRIGDISALYMQNFMSWGGAQSAFFGGCGAWETAAQPAQRLINDQITAFVPGVILNISEMLGDLARAFDMAHIRSVLTLSPAVGNMAPIDHQLISMEVPLHGLDGMPTTYNVVLADVGLRTLRATAMATVDGNTLRIPSHQFELDYGRLVQYIWVHGILPLLGYTTSEAMLRAWIDCVAIGRSLAMSPGILSESAYTSACNAGITAAASALDTRIAGAVPGEGTLTIMGTANGTMIGTDHIAQRLDMGMWTGAWGDEMMTMPITGTFTGMRRTR